MLNSPIIKNLAMLFFVLCLTYSLSAQEAPTFKIVGSSTNSESVQKGKRLDNSKINIENISDGPIYLKWETVYNSFPDGWDCSMCQHGKCKIGIPEGSVFKKLNADQQGFIAIHVLPGDYTGKGIVTFKVYDKDNPDYSRQINFEVEVL